MSACDWQVGKAYPSVVPTTIACPVVASGPRGNLQISALGRNPGRSVVPLLAARGAVSKGPSSTQGLPSTRARFGNAILRHTFEPAAATPSWLHDLDSRSPVCAGQKTSSKRRQRMDPAGTTITRITLRRPASLTNDGAERSTSWYVSSYFLLGDLNVVFNTNPALLARYGDKLSRTVYARCY